MVKANQIDLSGVVHRVQDFLLEVRADADHLKPNNEKTEVVPFASKQPLSKVTLDSLNLCNFVVRATGC